MAIALVILFACDRSPAPEPRGGAKRIQAPRKGSGSAPASAGRWMRIDLCGERLEAPQGAPTPLERAIIPEAQRALIDATNGKGATLAFVHARADRAHEATLRIVIRSKESCDVLSTYASSGRVLRGPFAGIASDFRWRAMLLEGRLQRMLVLIDAANVPRYAYILDAWEFFSGPRAEESGYLDEPGTGRTLEPLHVFPSGSSLLVSSYLSGDGATDQSLRLLQGMRMKDGRTEIALVASESRMHQNGIPFLFDVRAVDTRPEPSLEFLWSTGSWMLSATGPLEPEFGRPQRVVRAWSERYQRFR